MIIHGYSEIELKKLPDNTSSGVGGRTAVALESECLDIFFCANEI